MGSPQSLGSCGAARAQTRRGERSSIDIDREAFFSVLFNEGSFWGIVDAISDYNP